MVVPLLAAIEANALLVGVTGEFDVTTISEDTGTTLDFVAVTTEVDRESPVLGESDVIALVATTLGVVDNIGLDAVPTALVG